MLCMSDKWDGHIYNLIFILPPSYHIHNLPCKKVQPHIEQKKLPDEIIQL